MSNLQVEHLLINELKPFDKNPRKNLDAVEAVKESIKKYGFNQPILIDQNKKICAGHTRWQAAKELNLIRIPCVIKHMTDEEFLEYNLADNKTGELAKWDNKRLKDVMSLIDEVTNLTVPGFDDGEIDKIFGHKHNETHGSSSADFGDAGEVTDEIDEEALVKSMTFKLNGREHRVITSKLKAVQKEHGLRTLADALMKAMESVKGLSETKIRKGAN